ARRPRRGEPNTAPPIPARQIELTFVNRGSAGVHVRPWNWLTFNYQYLVDSRSNDTFDAKGHSYANSVSLTLTPLPELEFFAGYTHRNLDNRSTIYFAPLFTQALSLQRGNEDIFTTELRWDFGLFGQRWSTGWNVAYVNVDNTLAPNLEPGTTTGFSFYDLHRVDGGPFLTGPAPWLGPSVEFGMMD